MIFSSARSDWYTNLRRGLWLRRNVSRVWTAAGVLTLFGSRIRKKGADVQHHAGGRVDTTATSIHGQSPRVTLKALLEAGVHFGHQAKRWNPKMKPYIFAERNGIHIIDLQQTVPLLAAAHDFVVDATSRGGKILFVGTKKQAQDVVDREARRSGQYFVNRRWLGGTLTNFVTIRNRLRYMKQLQAEMARGAFDLLPKQEAAGKMAELERLERTLGGMRDMTQLPAGIFIIDPKREQLAVHEARRLGIPVIAVTDTNCDPDDADFLIPANDDAIRAVRLLTAGIADAAIEGQTRFEIAQADREIPAESRRSDFAELFAGDEDSRDLVTADVAAGPDGDEAPA
jgi:small subunit ribosomal protein S2